MLALRYGLLRCVAEFITQYLIRKSLHCVALPIAGNRAEAIKQLHAIQN